MIEFYGEMRNNGFLSNFYPSYMTMPSSGRIYNTVEHYFQSKKFEGTKWERFIAGQKSPVQAKKHGGRRDLPLREDWEDVKEIVMMKGLLVKFQLKDLRLKLLNTGEEELVEVSPMDYYWGIGKNRTGKNRLGVLLMQTRRILRQSDQRIMNGMDDGNGSTAFIF